MMGMLIYLLLTANAIGETRAPVLPGYVVHFDCIASVAEAVELVDIAQQAGARVLNIVPPAHIWESPLALQMLDAILNEISRRDLRFVLTRIDASWPPEKARARYSYLYGRILTRPGVLPDGSRSSDYFRTTAGRPGYVEWMEEETRYYARRCGRSPRLLGINLGPFSEPFSSERGGFLQYDRRTRLYEITQYTPDAERLWHAWLSGKFSSLAAVNREYSSRFLSLGSIPLPRSEGDRRFGRAPLAFFDFVSCLNDWFVDSYERCRRIWHDESGRSDVPFILQFSGGVAEKFASGRPSFAAFDLPQWVARADALGISLYTNSGFRDLGHHSIIATVNLIAAAREYNKDVFALEGGFEAPNVRLDARELAFFGEVARKLTPRTYIYEFLKDRFDETYSSNPGKLVTGQGKIRCPAFVALRGLFTELEQAQTHPERPVLYYMSDPRSARGGVAAGRLNAALYDIAGYVPVRWIVTSTTAALLADVPRLLPDCSVDPANARLTQFLTEMPPGHSEERATWRRKVIREILRGAQELHPTPPALPPRPAKR